KLFGLCAQSFGDRVDDPPIRLMRYDAFNARDIDLTTRHRFRRGCLHRLDRVLERFLAFHPQIVQTRRNGFSCSRATTTTTRHKQQIGLLTISAHYRSKKSVRVGAVLENGSAGAIAKENTGVAVFPIDN